MKFIALALLIQESQQACWDTTVNTAIGGMMVAMQADSKEADAVAQYGTKSAVDASIATNAPKLVSAKTALDLLPAGDAKNTAGEAYNMQLSMQAGLEWLSTNHAKTDRMNLAAVPCKTAIEACKAGTNDLTPVYGADNLGMFEMMGVMCMIPTQYIAVMTKMNKFEADAKTGDSYAAKSAPDKETWDEALETLMGKPDAAYTTVVDANAPDTWVGKANISSLRIAFTSDEKDKCDKAAPLARDADCITKSRTAFDKILAEMKTAKDFEKTMADFTKVVDAKKAGLTAAALDALKPAAGKAGADCKKTGEAGAEARPATACEGCCGDAVAKPADGAEAVYTDQLEQCGGATDTEVDVVKTAATATANGMFEVTTVAAVMEKFQFRCIVGAKSVAASAAALAITTYMMA